MSVQELYEATQGVWLIRESREKVQFAFATFRGIVREVYQVDSWLPAGSTDYLTRPAEEVRVSERWEFVGRVAETTLREKYLDKSVRAYFSDSSQNPLKYVSC